MQSRYYNPTIGRFINADVYTSTGQGVLGNNMFAYCGNNPISHSDSSGYSYTGTLNGYTGRDVMSTCLKDGGGAGGVLVGGIWITGEAIKTFNKLCDDILNYFYPRSKRIDWEKGDKNHILKGTDKRHIAGWRRFGIDPDNGNNNENWLLVLRILQEVVDDADNWYQGTNKDGSICTYYVKTFVEEGVKVVVKIWNGFDGTIQQISDAIPYLLN